MIDKPQPSKEQIELLAYELYLQRGAQPGQDLADWLAAEQELMAQQESIPMAPAAQPKVAPKARRELATAAASMN
jgi:hypothetical protein